MNFQSDSAPGLHGVRHTEGRHGLQILQVGISLSCHLLYPKVNVVHSEAIEEGKDWFISWWMLRRTYRAARPLKSYHAVSSQSNNWYRGPTELVQHFAYWGSSNRYRRSYTLNWYGLAISLPFPSGGGGVLLVKWFLPASAAPRGKGAGSQHLVCKLQYCKL